MTFLQKAIAAAAVVLTINQLLPRRRSPSLPQGDAGDLALAFAERDRLLSQLRAEIDGRERAEAALVQAKKIEAVGQLTGGIAHDFNNLLQAVAGNLELISMARTSPIRSSAGRPMRPRQWSAEPG